MSAWFRVTVAALARFQYLDGRLGNVPQREFLPRSTRPGVQSKLLIGAGRQAFQGAPARSSSSWATEIRL
jgi:uncharacterized protein YfiM (DUF2279 family)